MTEIDYEDRYEPADPTARDRDESRWAAIAPLADAVLALLPHLGDRTGVLRAAADAAAAGKGGCCWQADVLRRMADEAQQAGNAT